MPGKKDWFPVVRALVTLSPVADAVGDKLLQSIDLAAAAPQALRGADPGRVQGRSFSIEHNDDVVSHQSLAA
jgi:hypothetical protein